MAYIEFSDDDIKQIKKWQKPPPKNPLVILTDGIYELISDMTLLHEKKRVIYRLGRKTNESLGNSRTSSRRVREGTKGNVANGKRKNVRNRNLR